MLTPPSSIEPAATDQPARLHVLVICGKVVASYPLPESGHVRIGRSPACEILIDDTSISRTHASLSLGPPLAITDLGSANGTRVRDQRIPPHQATPITPGEAIQIGAATLIVQKQAAPMRPRRLWAHDYFEVRLEEECVRAARHGAVFAVLRLSCGANTPEDVMQHALANLVQVSDVVGLYGPNEYEVLLVDTDLETIDATAKRFRTALEANGINVRVGTACYPRDGHGADELMARAEASARGPVEKQRGGVLVADRTMQDLYALAERIAIGTISVLILGETGVGKEILAEQVHKVSPRASKPYLRLNCAALTESLLESELFGYERGAFTGAVQTKQGLLETADGGSIFLDEVGELPMSTQVKLLRVIEERVVMRVGGLKPRPLDVRFIAATNRDLEAEIVRGRFRQDLYFRLNGATLIIPPLRDRPAEIPPLAAAFVKQATRLAGLDREPKLSPEALDQLMRYSWPGNIRELRNVIERAVLLCGTSELQPRHLPLEKMRVTFAMPAAQPLAQVAAQAQHVEVSPPRMIPTDTPTETRVVPALLRRGRRLSADEERAQIEAALQACGGNQTRAAKLLGIGRRTLINRVQEFGLARPRAGNETTETLDAVGDEDDDT